jgi:hypothetical protein
MKTQLIKIHTRCRDKATQLEGTLTHWSIDMDGAVNYLFQPPGLNPEDGQPVSAVYLEVSRLEIIDSDAYEEVEIPFDILGSQVVHDASGFNGMATMFVRHPHGCFHVMIQPSGVLDKTKCPIKSRDFALTGCSGNKIPKLSPDEKKIEEIKKPSPDGDHDFTSAPFGT